MSRVTSSVVRYPAVFVTATTTILHATTNNTVDVVLALLLILGGAAGVQFGLRVGARLRGEELRALFAILVVAVALRLFIDLVRTPPDLYSVVLGAP